MSLLNLLCVFSSLVLLVHNYSLISLHTSVFQIIYALCMLRACLLAQKLLYTCVLGMLREQLEYADHLVLVLPAFVGLIENATDDEYRSILQPELKKIISMPRPVQVSHS